MGENFIKNMGEKSMKKGMGVNFVKKKHGWQKLRKNMSENLGVSWPVCRLTLGVDFCRQ